ncbi:hypothetical protein [Litoreibacter albidus]|uniref:Uncharacterized protein n=1 Tax=Litoreibacter albidus TaxID=670155 RepID=A0A1H2T235_9RHOB|nr:hypothetical protein [Litoreibacter albidus]SDW37918.1 hypothetical protein SAMN04488001_1034 [Litoreibacter albidus]
MLELHAPVNRLRPNIVAVISLIALALAGCSPNAPSHLPNPVLLPAHAVGNAVSNATYNARRATVKSYVARNFSALTQNIRTGGGDVLSKAYDLARVPTQRRPALTQMLAADPALSADVEALTVSLMVHGI